MKISRTLLLGVFVLTVLLLNVVILYRTNKRMIQLTETLNKAKQRGNINDLLVAAGEQQTKPTREVSHPPPLKPEEIIHIVKPNEATQGASRRKLQGDLPAPQKRTSVDTVSIDAVDKFIGLLCDQWSNNTVKIEGIPTDLQVCARRVRTLYNRIIKQYDPFTSVAVATVWKNFLPTPYGSGRYKGYDQSVQGVRFQIIDGEIYYDLVPKGAPGQILFFEPAVSFLTRTLEKYGDSFPNVDFTVMYGDICPQPRDTQRQRDQAEMTARLKEVEQQGGKDDPEAVRLRGELHKLQHIAPAFIYAQSSTCNGIAMPTYDWLWYTQDFMSGAAWRADSTKETEFVLKDKRAVFRGQVFGSRMRVLTAATSLQYPDLIDAKFTGTNKNRAFDMAWCNDLWLQDEEPLTNTSGNTYVPGSVPIPDPLETELPKLPKPQVPLSSSGSSTTSVGSSDNLCANTMAEEIPFANLLGYKYIVDANGWGTSFRFKNLLLSDSVTLKVENDFFEFYYDELQPYVHFVPVKRNKILTDLPQKVLWLQNNAKKAERIAKTSTQYVNQHLTEEHALWYQWAALQMLAAHTTYNVTRHDQKFQHFCCSHLRMKQYSSYCVDTPRCQQPETLKRNIDSRVSELSTLKQKQQAMKDQLDNLETLLHKIQQSQDDVLLQMQHVKGKQKDSIIDPVLLSRLQEQQQLLHLQLELQQMQFKGQQSTSSASHSNANTNNNQNPDNLMMASLHQQRHQQGGLSRDGLLNPYQSQNNLASQQQAQQQGFPLLQQQQQQQLYNNFLSNNQQGGGGGVYGQQLAGGYGQNNRFLQQGNNN